MTSVARGKTLVAKLRANPKVRDPEALAAWLGRVKRLKRGGLSTKAAMKAADGKDSSGGGSSKPSASSKPKRITAQEVDKEPWKFSASQYQVAKGVHQPHIAEISPMQFAHLSKRGKVQYEAKRRQEFQASADIKSEWRDKVEKAYGDGKINKDTPGLSKEARSVLIHSDIRRKKEGVKAAEKAADEAATIRSTSEIQKGEELDHPIYKRVRVVRVSPKSIRVAVLNRDGEPMKNRDGSPSTVNIPAKHIERGFLKKRKKK